MKRKHKKENNIKETILIICIILIVFCIIKIVSKTKNIRYDTINLVIADKNITLELNNDIIKKENNMYLSFEDIKKFIDSSIYFEEESNTIIMTSDKKLASMKLEEEQIIINGAIQKIYGKSFKEKDIIYIPISELKNVYDMDFAYNENTNIITIDYISKELKKAYVSKNIKVRQNKEGLPNNIEKIKKGNWVIVFEIENGISKIRTQNGNIGYIKTKYLNNFITERENLLDTTENEHEEYLEKFISQEDIYCFDKRNKLINDIWLEAVKGDYKAVKIKCDNEGEETQRIKIELVPFLKESGIYTIIDRKD